MAYDATDFVVTEVQAPVRDPKTITDPRERVAYLRDFLRELPPEKFAMQTYAQNAAGDEIETAQEFHACGTAACICGWAMVNFTDHDDLGDHEIASATLGIHRDDAFGLFVPDHKDRSLITNLEAANVLHHYLATGKIDWSVA